MVAVGVIYFSTRILGLPLLTMGMLMDSSLRVTGATRYSMVAILSSTALNTVLDPIMIFGLFGFPKMGVAGAALATILSIAYIIPLEYVFLRKINLTPIFGLGNEYIVKMFRVGAPTALERLVFAIGNNAYIARCSEVALAAHQIGIRIESFIYMSGFVFMVAASALVGQRIGFGNVEEVRNIEWEQLR